MVRKGRRQGKRRQMQRAKENMWIEYKEKDNNRKGEKKEKGKTAGGLPEIVSDVCPSHS